MQAQEDRTQNTVLLPQEGDRIFRWCIDYSTDRIPAEYSMVRCSCPVTKELSSQVRLNAQIRPPAMGFEMYRAATLGGYEILRFSTT